MEHTTSLVERIGWLFQRHGDTPYVGVREEPISATAHALQCAQLAEWAHADTPLIAAAFLHDVGHLLVQGQARIADTLDDEHELVALPLLAQGFGPAVIEPVRLHVQAKRYLVRVDERYKTTLSPASIHSLVLQGGPMDDAEMAAFEALPYAGDALCLRRWDDLAKEPGRRTPPLAYYLALLDEVLERPFADSRIGIGAVDVA